MDPYKRRQDGRQSGHQKAMTTSKYLIPNPQVMVQCSKCSNPSITFIRYSGRHLCKKHFNEFMKKRVMREIRKQGVERDSKIAIGVSGGKDSVVALHLLKEIFSKREDIVIDAITVDEGIQSYRPESIKFAKENCKALGVEQYFTSFKEVVGIEMDEIAEHCEKISPCTYCGVFRRRCLNSKAREIGADKLATGLNLDDTAQSIIMNIARNDIEKLARLGPHSKIQEGLIPRIQPLRTIPEKETYLYAIINNIKFYDGECPYAPTAVRNIYREVIFKLEENSPGTRHAILNSYDEIADLLLKKYPPAMLRRCRKCDEPSINDVCKACELLKGITKKL